MSEKEKWEHLIRGYPGDFCFRGKVMPVFPLVIDEFNKLSEAGWSVENYEIGVGVTDDESYAAVSFLPGPASVISKGHAELSERFDKSVVGVIYVYRLKDYALVETRYIE